MYNEERKSAFLSEFRDSEKTEKLVRNIFISLSGFESRFDMDFSQFDDDQLRESVPRVAGIRSESAWVIISYLKKYVRWCDSNGHSTSKSIFEYKIDLSDKIRENYVRSPEHLLYVMDHIMDDARTNEIQYIYRTYLWLAYFGVTEKEAARISAGDVDFRRMRIRCGDVYRPMCDEAITDLRYACSLRDFMGFNGTARTMHRRADGEEILRGKRTNKPLDEAITSTFRVAISRYVKEAKEKIYVGQDRDLESLNLSFRKVYLSGIFYRAYQEEGLGIVPDFSQITDERYERSKDKYDHSDDKARDAKGHMRRGYLEDYEGWKRAFELDSPSKKYGKRGMTNEQQ